MRKRAFLSLFLIALIILCFSIGDVISRGGGGGGHGGGKGGHYTGGPGGGRKGSHYSNPSTGNHYGRRGSSSGSYSSHAGSGHVFEPSITYSSPARLHSSVVRDEKGKIVRSEAAKEAFLRSRGLTKVPPGYQVDHIIPLYAGGSDTPSNMQLLTVSEHQAKTKADYQRYGK